VIRVLTARVWRELFDIAELNTQSFQIPESAFTVMAMTSGAAAAAVAIVDAGGVHRQRRLRAPCGAAWASWR
jgi:hypothetical protein